MRVKHLAALIYNIYVPGLEMVEGVRDFEILFSNEAGDRNKCTVSKVGKWVRLPSEIEPDKQVEIKITGEVPDGKPTGKSGKG